MLLWDVDDCEGFCSASTSPGSGDRVAVDGPPDDFLELVDFEGLDFLNFEFFFVLFHDCSLQGDG